MPTPRALPPSRPPLEPSTTAPAHNLWLAVALVIAALALLPWLEILPGLHGDEAWAGYRAHRIATQGFHPLSGMNFYTGPLHQYLLAPVLQTLGYTVFALRLPTVLASLASVALLYFATRRMFGGRVAAIAVMLLVSLPFFAIYGRIATENFVVNPPAAIAGTLCLLIATDPSARMRALAALGAGVLLALGTWTHTIFAPVVAFAFLVALVNARARLFRSRTFWTVALGFGIGLLPRFYQIATHVPAAREFGLGTQASGSGEIVAEIAHYLSLRAREWPALFLQVLHGDLLYLRHTGEIAWPVPSVNGVLFALSLIGIAWRCRGASTRERARLYTVLLALPGILVLTLVITTHNSDRYFLLPLYLAPLWIALAIDWLWQKLGSSRAARIAIPVAVAALVGVNLARTGVNFFATHLRTGGKNLEIALGSELEATNHFVRSDQLYEYLVASHIKHVMAEFFIGAPLCFYDLAHHRLDAIVLVEDLRPNDLIPRDLYVVAYNGGRRRLVPEQIPPPLTPKQIVHQDSHFTVLK